MGTLVDVNDVGGESSEHESGILYIHTKTKRRKQDAIPETFDGRSGRAFWTYVHTDKRPKHGSVKPKTLLTDGLPAGPSN